MGKKHVKTTDLFFKEKKKKILDDLHIHIDVIIVRSENNGHI